jgi:molybdate transport system substrate-binding protein
VRVLLAVALLACAAPHDACAGGSRPAAERASAGGSPRGAERRLLVFAASSLTDAFSEIARSFEQAHPGVRIELEFAGSQVLRTQIEHGAPADLFASADSTHARALAAAKLLDEPVRFAGNSLVVVSRAEAPGVRGIADLAASGVAIVAGAPTLPAGRYTDEVLSRIAASGDFGPDVAARIAANIVSRETNVRAVLSKIVLGEADAAFVYRTDAASAPPAAVTVLAIPDSLNVVAEYVIARTASSPDPGLAAQLVAFLLDAPGQAILARHGFVR